MENYSHKRILPPPLLFLQKLLPTSNVSAAWKAILHRTVIWHFLNSSEIKKHNSNTLKFSLNIYRVYQFVSFLSEKNRIKFWYTTVVSVTVWLNFVLILVLNWLYSVRQIYLLPYFIYRRHSIKIKRRR